MNDALFQEAAAQLAKAEAKHAPMRGWHEGYAVILEELDELWQEVKRQQVDVAAMRKEAMHVAVMGLRFVKDVCGAAVPPAEPRMDMIAKTKCLKCGQHHHDWLACPIERVPPAEAAKQEGCIHVTDSDQECPICDREAPAPAEGPQPEDHDTLMTLLALAEKRAEQAEFRIRELEQHLSAMLKLHGETESERDDARRQLAEAQAARVQADRLADDALALAVKDRNAAEQALAEAQGCDGNCGCVISSRHDWYEAFCKERKALAEAQQQIWAVIRQRMAAEGYRLEETSEGGERVIRMFRSDGSVAMTARKTEQGHAD